MERNLTWHNMDIDRTLREQQNGAECLHNLDEWPVGSGKVNNCECVGKAFVCNGKEDHAFGWGQCTYGIKQ